MKTRPEGRNGSLGPDLGDGLPACSHAAWIFTIASAGSLVAARATPDPLGFSVLEGGNPDNLIALARVFLRRYGVVTSTRPTAWIFLLGRPQSSGGSLVCEVLNQSIRSWGRVETHPRSGSPCNPAQPGEGFYGNPGAGKYFVTTAEFFNTLVGTTIDEVCSVNTHYENWHMCIPHEILHLYHGGSFSNAYTLLEGFTEYFA